MRILHVTPSYKPAFHYGGPTVSVSRLAEAQVAAGTQVAVYSTTADGDKELPVEPGARQLVDGVVVWYFPRWTGDHGHFSPALLWRLWQTARQFDVVHIHSWWNWVAFGAALVCHLRGVNTFVSPHGMLSAYTLHSRGRHLFQKTIGNWLLKGLTVHTTSSFEAREFRHIAPERRSVSVPNIVEIPPAVEHRQRPDGAPFQFLFISRVHPKKGIDLLMEALAGLDLPWELQIAGDGPPHYERQMKTKARKLGIAQRLNWIGWVGGAAKWDLMANADLMVLTSHNENFAIVVVEALALGTPVLVTDQVGLCDYVARNDFGWVCNRDIPEMRQALRAAIVDQQKRARIAQVAPRQIPADFDPQKLALRYFDMYRHGSTEE